MSDAPIAPLPRWVKVPDRHFQLIDGVPVEMCPDCDRKPIKLGYKTCYRCHVNGFGVNWHGGGFLYGRDNFSSRTNAEYIAEHVGDTTGAAHMGSLDWKDI